MLGNRSNRLVCGTFSLWFAAAVTLSVCAQEPQSASRGLGRRFPDFSLKDTLSGQRVSLYGLAGKKAVVIVFIGTDCPLGNLYLPRLVELAKTFRPRGVEFLAINANSHEPAQAVAEHARSFGVDFPVLKDPGNVVADSCLAEFTNEALVLDAKATLRYRGAIDDQYGVDYRRHQPEATFLVDALEAILAGREVARPATEVEGCLIDRVIEKPVAELKRMRVRPAPRELREAYDDPDAPQIDVGQVSYAADVAPILQQMCQPCHRPGQSAPFSLLSYDQARRWSATIQNVVEERRMPPWHADPRYGKFDNDRSLTARERAVLLAWVDQGAPLGDPSAVPAPRKFPETWAIGTPDVVLQMEAPFEVPATGTVPYRYFQVPTHFAEDKWVQAVEIKPGERSVVHHIQVFVDDHTPDSYARARGLNGSLAIYAPGDQPTLLPPGTAKRVPAGADLVFQVHYTPVGQPKSDRSSVALRFAKEPPQREAKTIAIANHNLLIPPFHPEYEVTSEAIMAADCWLLSLMPHMHLRGKDFRYTAVYPDGKSEVLLSVPAFDFGWQSLYRLAEPKPLPRGTRIQCLAHFDNSANNPSNPDPKEHVRWGNQTDEEMMVGFLEYSENLPTSHKGGR